MNNSIKTKHSFRKFLLIYTAFFFLLFSVIAVGFYLSGKSFIYEARMGDGLRQHYVSLAYFGHYLRQFIKNILFNHTFELPMWDFSIGYGSDILATLHYYAIGDPLNLLSAVVPYKYTEYLYDALIVLRIWLAGVTFSLYSRYHKNDDFPTLLGALLYAFCQWTLVAGFKHPFFINPCIYFPLLILGVDKIYKKEKPYLYIIAVAVSAMSNFYFFYMLGIFTVIYAIYRYFMLYRKINLKELGSNLGKFALFSTIGLLISSVIFFPSLCAVLGTDRVGAKNFILSTYRTEYYHKLFPALIGEFQRHFTIIGISSVGILGVFILFSKRKKNLALKIGFLMCMVFISIPYVAHVFNGFSYVTNRWCWALTMLMSYIFVKMEPEIFNLSKKQRIGILIALVIFAAYICVDSYAGTKWNILAIALVFGMWLLFTAGYRYFLNHRNLVKIFLLAGISAGTLLNIYFCFYCTDYEDVNTSQFSDSGTAYEKNITNAVAAISDIDDISQYRYEQGASGILQNAQVMAGINGGQFFFSLANGDVSQFQNELYPYKPLGQNFYNFNSRVFPLKLLSTKYFIGVQKYAPYGYKKLRQIKVPALSNPDVLRNIYLYEDPDALPFAYTYDSFISRDSYEKMNVMERQQALLQGVVLEDSELKECTPEDTSSEISYTITPLKNCEIYDHRIKAKEALATCLLEFKGLPKSELCVAFDNLQYLAVNRRHKYTDEEWNALSRKEQREIMIKDQKVTNDFAIYLGADINGYYSKKEIHMVTDRNNFYNGRHNFMSNLGYSEDSVTQVLVTFQKKGSYAYDDLSIYCQPVDRLSGYTAKLKEDKIDNLEAEYDDVSCSVNLSERKAVVFSIPYNKGWSAVVDGKETELKKANTMFMALELDKGNHEIKLHYMTPHIRLFLFMSVVGVLLLIGLIFIGKGNTPERV